MDFLHINKDYMVEENDGLRDSIKRIVVRLQEAGDEVGLKIVEEETGVTAEHILNPRCLIRR